MISDHIAEETSPRVVIIGGGFGGLHAARGLAKTVAKVTLYDRRNYHLFQPLLYQVATAELEPNNIAFPIRKILNKQNNCDVALGEVSSIDLNRKKISDVGALKGLKQVRWLWLNENQIHDISAISRDGLNSCIFHQSHHILSRINKRLRS